jgi:hypothetical protein
VAEQPAVPLTVFYDVHCPYSDRVLAWLADLGRDLVEPTYRVFPLEQVNHDPSARLWRIWEQSLDYDHYQARPDRRAFLAFVAILLAERVAPRDTVDAFRLLVSRARHGMGLDISGRDLLLELAGDSGVDASALGRALEDPAAVDEARVRIAADWADARGEYEIFGVPTLRVAGVPPFYLRLDRVPRGDDARELLASIRDFGGRLPQVLEIKVPERTRTPVALA